ncbi:MAG: glycosyltransferase family 2 protein [Bacteroidetes bacterium]|nr:glycosyltransferase family 2 protein [Bacteroidota bacterium]
MAQPLVSVILTTYNRADLLSRAVESVLMQSWQNWELIVIDDGSTDGTPKLLAEFVRLDARVRTLRQENQGPGRSRNRALHESYGDMISVLDSDDAYAVDHLYLRVRYMIDHPEVDFIYGGYRAIGSDTQMLVPDMDDPSIQVPLDECVIGGTFFARRGVIEEAGGWDHGYGEDARLFARIRSSFMVKKVDFPTYLYHRDTIDSRCTRLVP